ncbi:MAG: prohibitin family protein [Bacteroidetes bacterium]|nr:prohibitin family protein [Bacteroidota bacterium]
MGLILLGIVFAAAAWLMSDQVFKYRSQLRIVAGVILFATIIAASTVMIPAGHVGVKVMFGAVDTSNTIGEGLHFVNPLLDVKSYSIRTQEIYEGAEVPSKEGLSINLEVSLLFRLDISRAAHVYQTVGEAYKDVVVVTTLRSAIRSATVNYEAKDLYTSGRELIAGAILKELDLNLRDRGIIIESVLLRKITLPKQVEEAINNKLAAEQESERMKFILQKEEQEAQRKGIEAKGIATYQETVRRGLDMNLLKWKALEAVNELAKSPNSKFVILGDKSGLPIILNDK